MGFLNPNNWFAGQNDPTAATNMNGGKAVAPGQLAYQGVNTGSGQNSLEQYLRSLTNMGGQTAQNMLQTGMGTTASGIAATQGPMDYYSRLLSGNPAAMSQAIQPEAGAIRQQFGQLRNQSDQFAPMGGGRSSMMASLPFQQQGAIGNLLASVRPQAASQLGSLGLGIGGLGLGQQQLGSGMLSSVLQALYGGRGQDIEETGQNKNLAGVMSQGLGQGLGAAMGAP